MKKTITLLGLTLLLSLTACQNGKENQAEHDAKIAAQAKKELRAELKAEQEAKAKQQEIELQKDNKFAHMGISTNNGKLIIDTNKTQSYFQKMAEKLRAHAEKFAKEMKSGSVNEKEAGIVVTDTQINIDLNKTKSFLDTWGETLQNYAKDFQHMTEELNTSK